MNLRPSQLPVLRQISVRAAMDILLHEGPTSRATLAKKTGLSKQTMSEVIRALEESGWVRAKGIISGKVGRSAITYEVADDAGYAVGIDLGATTIRIAVVSISGRIVHESEHPTGGRVANDLIEHMHDLVETSLKENGLPFEKILLGSVATPGVIDPITGTLSLAQNIGETGSLDVVTRLSEALGCEVVVENDVNAAAIGESWKGRSAGLETAAFISLGTGVGLGLLINGKLAKGAKGAAGEIAYLPFGSDPYSADSLERGALETAIGAQGIVSRYRTAGGSAPDVRSILQEAEAGQEPAASVIRETARLASLLIVSVDAMIDPEKIVLGGNVGRHPLILKLVGEEVPRLTRRTISIEPSLLGSRATLIGSVAVALNQLHNALFSPQDLPSEMRLPQAATQGV
ncbi:ROK family transcriptional regulator [Rhizobium oryzicola]|uniref:ROK family transcriptional regulator n=1 Tax=Rhizobium oryzicola TaxID=1232668 RepID=A0ABT8T300_9HYPH|nr:ROK family transcriptional regulator [Rhizobium oryzicola]MDO1585041.1 ROK family transcriptional regulator [Rhizobium oryzicola]